MNRIAISANRILLGAALIVGIAGTSVAIYARPGQQQQQQLGYTRDEYDAYIACHNEKVPEKQIACFDAFVAKSPGAAKALQYYIQSDYYAAYVAVKDYAKAIEALDKILALGEQVSLDVQLASRGRRAEAFMQIAAQVKDPAQLNAAREAARQGLKDVDGWKKPAAVSQADYDTQKKQLDGIFWTVIAQTSVAMKDMPATIEAYKAILALDPTQAETLHYKMGVMDLQQTPPQFYDGIWELARAASAKGPNAAPITDYLTKVIMNYQGGNVCANLTKDEVDQLVTLAAGGGDRPSTYTLASADDLQKAQQDMTNFIANLRAGGDAGKVTWLATCGLEFPEIVTKLISLDTPDGGPIVLHGFTGATSDETQAGTVADMVITLDGSQPEAKRLKPEDELRFGGTLVGYDQSPFMLHWDKAKVNPDDIPTETGKKPAPRKKPGGARQNPNPAPNQK